MKKFLMAGVFLVAFTGFGLAGTKVDVVPEAQSSIGIDCGTGKEVNKALLDQGYIKIWEGIINDTNRIKLFVLNSTKSLAPGPGGKWVVVLSKEDGDVSLSCVGAEGETSN